MEHKLRSKIKDLNETIWEQKAKHHQIDAWLSNFKEEERLGALYLLSNFMYFGGLQMRELLKAVYRDLYRYPIIEKIRRSNSDSLDSQLIEKLFTEELKHTRFLGVGNPSESGPHLLYYFRQENKIPKDLFINTHEIIDISAENVKLKNEEIRHLVYLDDFCGSGTQATMENYTSIIKKIKSLNPNIQITYLMLFGTEKGKNKIRNEKIFDVVETIFEFDESFKVFSEKSRYFKNVPPDIDKDIISKFCAEYGTVLYESIWKMEGVKNASSMGKRDSLGFKDSQLLVGFQHNVPTNTLPIIWYDEKEVSWLPIFKRYNKIYRKI
jgi:hypothetical protein